MPRSVLLVLVGLGLAALTWFAWPHGPEPAEDDGEATRDHGAQPSDAREDESPRLAPGGAGPAARRGVRPASTASTRTEPGEPSVAATPTAPAAPEPIGPFGRLEVAVRGPGGEEVARAYANVIDAEGSRVVRIEDGRLRIDLRALDRPLDLEVFGAQRADGIERPWGWTIQRVAAAAAGGSLEVRLPKELTIAGALVDSGGLPLAGVEVSGDAVRPPPLGSGGSRRDLASRTRTEPDGRFVLRGLGAGEIDVGVASPPTLQRRRPLRTTAGTQGVRIVLERAAPASVRVLDPSDHPVASALVWVSVQDLGARRVEPLHGVGYGRDNLTDAQGVWAVPHLAPGESYRLRVEPPRERVDLVRQEIQGWKPADTTVRLAAGNVVRGHVRDPQGRPVPEANLYFRQAGRWQSGQVDRDGAFEIGGLEPGEALLRATTAPDSLHEAIEGLPMFVEARVATGRGDVVLTVERGHALGIRLEGWPADRGYREGVLHAEGLAGGRTWHVGTRVDHEGRILFHGLEPVGTYAFWLPPQGGELCALVQGIRADAGSITVPVRVGTTITGRLVRPEGADRGVVQAFLHGRPFHVEALPETDGTFVLRGLPTGTRWRVIGACNVGESYRHATAEDVPAGGSIELAPQRP